MTLKSFALLLAALGALALAIPAHPQGLLNGDNLGNHRARKDLNMNNFSVVNVATISATTLSVSTISADYLRVSTANITRELLVTGTMSVVGNTGGASPALNIVTNSYYPLYINSVAASGSGLTVNAPSQNYGAQITAGGHAIDAHSNTGAPTWGDIADTTDNEVYTPSSMRSNASITGSSITSVNDALVNGVLHVDTITIATPTNNQVYVSTSLYIYGDVHLNDGGPRSYAEVKIFGTSPNAVTIAGSGTEGLITSGQLTVNTGAGALRMQTPNVQLISAGAVIEATNDEVVVSDSMTVTGNFIAESQAIVRGTTTLDSDANAQARLFVGGVTPAGIAPTTALHVQNGFVFADATYGYINEYGAGGGLPIYIMRPSGKNSMQQAQIGYADVYNPTRTLEVSGTSNIGGALFSSTSSIDATEVTVSTLRGHSPINVTNDFAMEGNNIGSVGTITGNGTSNVNVNGLTIGSNNLNVNGYDMLNVKRLTVSGSPLTMEFGSPTAAQNVYYTVSGTTYIVVSATGTVSAQRFQLADGTSFASTSTFGGGGVSNPMTADLNVSSFGLVNVSSIVFNAVVGGDSSGLFMNGKFIYNPYLYDGFAQNDFSMQGNDIQNANGITASSIYVYIGATGSPAPLAVGNQSGIGDILTNSNHGSGRGFYNNDFYDIYDFNFNGGLLVTSMTFTDIAVATTSIPTQYARYSATDSFSMNGNNITGLGSLSATGSNVSINGVTIGTRNLNINGYDTLGMKRVTTSGDPMTFSYGSPAAAQATYFEVTGTTYAVISGTGTFSVQRVAFPDGTSQTTAAASSLTEYMKYAATATLTMDGYAITGSSIDVREQVSAGVGGVINLYDNATRLRMSMNGASGSLMQMYNDTGKNTVYLSATAGGIVPGGALLRLRNKAGTVTITADGTDEYVQASSFVVNGNIQFADGSVQTTAPTNQYARYATTAPFTNLTASSITVNGDSLLLGRVMSNNSITGSSLTISGAGLVGTTFSVQVSTLYVGGGRVGINTSAPATDLHVTGNGGGNAQVNIGGTGVNFTSLVHAGSFYVDEKDSGNSIVFRIGSNDRFTVGNTGLTAAVNLGMGTNSISWTGTTNATVGTGTNDISIRPQESAANAGKAVVLGHYNSSGGNTDNFFVYRSSVVIATPTYCTQGIFSNGRKVVDQYDFAVQVSSPYSLSQAASFASSSWTLISPYRSYAHTISTLTARIEGAAGSSVVLQVCQSSAIVTGTRQVVWTGTVTASPGNIFGGTFLDNTVPVDNALWVVIGTVTGAVDRLLIRGVYTKD